jgi:hypothetical protein
MNNLLSIIDDVTTQITPIVESQGISSAGSVAVLGATGQFDKSVIPGGSSGGSSTYVFDQVLPNTTWYIEHDLFLYPSVTVVDSAGNLVMGAIQYISNTEVIINFGSAMAGQAFLN